MTTPRYSIPPEPRPVLTREQRSVRTAELFAAACGTSDRPQRDLLLEEVVLVNLRVAQALSERFAGRGVSDDDLRQVACEGLVKAVQRFDRDRGTEFLSFAVPTIRGELQRYFRDLGWVIRPTRRVQETQWRIRHAEDELAQRLGRTPSTQEVSDELDIATWEYLQAASAVGCFRPDSLDQPLSPDEYAVLGDLLPQDRHALSACEARLTVVPLVKNLPERDRQILYMRFYQELTQQQIGNLMGVTQTQVSRLLRHILEELHASMTKRAEAGSTGSPVACAAVTNPPRA